MRRTVMIGALGLAVFITAPNDSAAAQKAAAGFIDGKTLFERCNAMGSFTGAGPGDAVIGSCMGYILGIADVMRAGAVVRNYKACFPPKAQFVQIRATVMADLKRFPQFRKLPAAQLVAAAFAFAYPCRDPRETTVVERRRGAGGKTAKTAKTAKTTKTTKK